MRLRNGGKVKLGIVQDLSMKCHLNMQRSQTDCKEFFSKTDWQMHLLGSFKEFPISKITVVQTQLTTVKLYTAI